MSTAIAEYPQPVDERVITYTPFGESKAIKLTLGMIRSYIAVPTRQGKVPSDSELMKFMMLCQARELNPWVGDAYLVGYDSQDGPKFSLITAIQALLKRAEVNPNFDGLESGVVVIKGDEVRERQGDLVLPGETLHGAWARCHRKDRSVPFYDSLKLATFNTNKSQWAKDPAGMIVKCAQASVLRMAFPSQIGSLYIEQERGIIEKKPEVQPSQMKKLTVVTDAITGKLTYQDSGPVLTNEESQEDHDVSSDGGVAGGDPEMESMRAASESHDSAAAAFLPTDDTWSEIEFSLVESKTLSDVKAIGNQWAGTLTRQGDLELLDKLVEQANERIRSKRGK